MQALRGGSNASCSRAAASRPLQARPVSSSIGLVAARKQQSRQVSCAGLFGLGLPEVVVIAGVTALIFGPSKLPELGKGLGKTVKSFQTAAKEFESELKQAVADEDGGGSASSSGSDDAAAAAAKKKEGEA